MKRLSRWFRYEPVVVGGLAVVALYWAIEALEDTIAWTDVFVFISIVLIFGIVRERTYAAARVRDEGITIVEEEVVLLPPLPGDPR